MPRSRPRRTRIRLLAAERTELQRRVAARTSTQQDAYRAEIILRVAANQTDAAIAQEMGLAERTVFVWRHRFAEQRLDGLKDRPKCPPPRQYHADIQARLLVLACQKPTEVDSTRVGQTHWSIQRSGAVRGHPSRARSRSSQQEHHRRHPQAAPGSPGPSLTPG
jgi:transposase